MVKKVSLSNASLAMLPPQSGGPGFVRVEIQDAAGTSLDNLRALVDVAKQSLFAGKEG